MALLEQDDPQSAYLERRTTDRLAEIENDIKASIPAEPAKGEKAEVDPMQQVDSMPASEFGRIEELPDSPRSMFGFTPLGGGMLSNRPEGSLVERLAGKGFLSGVESEAIDTFSSVPNLAIMASTAGLGTIPAIAKIGGSKLLSLYFGAEMGKALWEKNKEYQQAIQEEGGFGPKSRELLGRMTVLAGFTISAGKHAAKTPAAGTGTPKPAEAKTKAAEAPKPEARSVEQVSTTRPFEMTREQLDEAIKADKAADNKTLTEVFGEEGAKKYKSLLSQENSVDIDRADRASAERQAMENNLTPQQQDKVFGKGQSGPTWEDYAEIRKALNRLDDESPETLGRSLRSTITDIGNIDANAPPGNMSHAQQIGVAQMLEAGRIINKNGWDSRKVLESAVRSAAEHFPDKEDALFMLERFIKKPKQLGGGGSPSLGSLRSGIDPIEAAKKLKQELKGEGEGDLRVNLKFIDPKEGVRETIATVNRMNSERMAKSREIRSHSETEEIAARLNLDVKKVLELPDNKLTEGQTLAVRNVVADTSSSVYEIAKAIIESGDLKNAHELLKPAWNLLGELQAKSEKLSRLPAREVESQKIMASKKTPVKTEDLAELLDRFGSTVDVDPMTLAKAIVSLPNNEARSSWASRVISAAKKGNDIFYEAWMQWGLLSNPATHAANIGGGILTSTWAPMERKIGATSRSIGRMFGAEGPGVEQGEATAMLRGAIDGWRDALRATGKAMWSGDDPRGGKLERREALKLGNDTHIGKAINLLYHINGRGLVGEDVFFKGINFDMQKKALALRQAMSEGLEGEKLTKRVAQIESDLPNSIKKEADQFALLQTFQNDLGKIGQALTTVRDAVPPFKYLQPFIRTIGNIGNWAGQRTPILAQISATNRADFMAGGARRDMAIARMTTGALTAAAVTSLYKAGYITGGGPKDKDLRDMNTRAGRPPYSIIVPGVKPVGYNRLDPVGAMVGVMADFMEISGNIPDKDAATLATSAVLALSKNMMSKTYTQGISTALDAIENPDKKGQVIKEGFARSLVPAFVRGIEREVDPSMREIEGMIESMKANTPGFSDSLPTMRDALGRKFLNPAGLGPDMASPIYMNPYEPDELSEELVRSGASERIHKPSDVFFGTNPPDLRMNPERLSEGVPLTPHQYDEYLQISGDAAVARLNQYIQTDAYKQQSDGPDGGKTRNIMKIIDQEREKARVILQRKYPELRAKINMRRRERQQALRPNRRIGL